MTERDKYRTLCEREQSIHIFQKDWWLDAVCGEDNWDAVCVEKGGTIVAALPYELKRKYNLKLIWSPKLTQFIGPWIKYPDKQSYTRRLGYEKELLRELILKLPQVDIINIQCHYEIRNWLPFYWDGFKQTTYYTYVIPDLSDMDLVYSGLQSHIRTDLKKAAKNVTCEFSDDIEVMFNLLSMTYKRQNCDAPYSLQWLKHLDMELKRHGARKIIVAKNTEGKMCSGAYIIWDNNSAYYLIGGQDPELRNNGSMSLVLWQAIEFAAQVTKCFNFEGSMVEGIEQFFRGFGGVQLPYFSLTKQPSWKGKFVLGARAFMELMK